MRKGWLSFCLVAVCAAQTGPGMVREGGYWVETVTGVAVAQPSELFRISTRGAVSLQGETRRDIAYTLKKRAAVGSEAAARGLLKKISVKTRQRGDELLLEVDVPGDWTSSASLDLRVPRKLRRTVIESQGDTIEAYDLAGALHADSGGGRVHVDRVQGDVIVRTGGGQVRLGKIGGGVMCFSGGGQIIADTISGPAGLNTEGGEIVVRLAKSPVRAATAGGNIRIEQADLGVTATAQAGLIEVARAGGPVIAKTREGAIKVRSASNVQCEAGAGAITLEAVYGGVRAATRSGSIVAELASKPLQDSSLATGAGDITVFIPSNLAVTVQAISASLGGRRIVSDFSEIQTHVAASARAEAQGSLNGGGPLLRLTALGGTIYLRRRN
jgi:hypothetical protein